MSAILSMPDIKSENACKWNWINRKGEKCVLKIDTRKQLEILATVISENCDLLQF